MPKKQKNYIHQAWANLPGKSRIGAKTAFLAGAAFAHRALRMAQHDDIALKFQLEFDLDQVAREVEAALAKGD